MSNQKYLTVLNLDKLVEDMIEVGGEIFKKISYEELEKLLTSSPYYEKLKKFLTSSPYVVYPEHDHYFALFKLIHKQPKKAIELLEKTAKHNISKPNNFEERQCFTDAELGGWPFIGIIKSRLIKEFEHESSDAPQIYSLTTYRLWGIVKDNPEKSLKFFQKCYEKKAKKNKIKDGWEEDKLKILAIVEALKTRNFSIKCTPEHLELKILPKKENIIIPTNINANNCAKLTKYLVDSEGASFKNLGFIKDKAILIPREGKEDWSKGLYIVTHDKIGKTELVYRTEKFHTEEELVVKTIGKGEVTKPPIDEITRTLIDLA